MKKLWLTVLLSPLFLMCRQNGNGGLHITEKVTDDLVYHFTADYPDSETGTVQNILSRHLKDTGMSFANAELDAEMGFDNGMFFYIKSHPGSLTIVCDRAKNSEENYMKIRKMCEAVKNSLGD
ncbi:MAG: hypothetical protein KF870_02745 [Leadbetterella sp.]|nr:hypothetical protein [Leadbetterella sp.]